MAFATAKRITRLGLLGIPWRTRRPPPIEDVDVGVPVLRLPVRLNEHAITFQFLNRDDIRLDPDFLEPIGSDIGGASLTAIGQVNFRLGPIKKRRVTLSGDDEPVEGHFVFRLFDMIEVGLITDNLDGTISFNVKKGDRVTRVDGVLVDFEIVEVRTESPLRGEFLLVYIEVVQGPDTRRGVTQ